MVQTPLRENALREYKTLMFIFKVIVQTPLRENASKTDLTFTVTFSLSDSRQHSLQESVVTAFRRLKFRDQCELNL